MQLSLSLLFLIIAIPFVLWGISMAPWVPTRKSDIQRFLELIQLKKWDEFLEIWTGDGRVAYAVAQKFPHANIRGIELAFPVFIFAYFRQIFGGQNNYHVRLGNAFWEDFGKYDVVYVFGMPNKMWDKIVPKFLREAKKWAKLYSYVFSIPQEYNKNVISYGKDNEAKIHILEKK